jgi:Dolichyl-phosphate-mannose-protein mannosyltransferase
LTSVLSRAEHQRRPELERHSSAAALWLIGTLALVIVALLVRVSLLQRASWLLEGDDALSALMALGILDGDRPVMLKNQTYGAAWEPYAMAASFVMFGISRVSAKLPELLTSVATAASTWYLARQAAGPIGARFAAVLATLPPMYVLVLSLKPWAPYTEVMVLGSLCLACAIRLGWHGGDVRTALVCGVLGGLAFWMHPLAIWYLTAAALSVFLQLRGLRLLRIAMTGVVGFLVGALPVWIYNVQSNAATLRYVLAGTQGQTADRWAVLSAWWNNDLPRGAGLWHPWGASPVALSWLMALVLVAATTWAVFARPRLATRPLDGVLLLLASIPMLFVLSGFGGPALNPYGFDATGRYTPPIWTALAVVVSAALAAAWPHRRALAVLACGVLLVVNAAAFLTVDPVQAFESPYWDRLPVDNGPLLQVLKAAGVSDIWINHWAGQPLMFDARVAGQPLIAYDWYDVQAGGIDRFPEYRALVEQADRAAYVLVTDEREPELEQRLHQLGIMFDEYRVAPYVVVLPTSRVVHPSEVTSALDYRY